MQITLNSKRALLLIIVAFSLMLAILLGNNYVSAHGTDHPELTEEQKAQIEKKKQDRQAEIERLRAEKQATVNARTEEAEAKREEVKQRFTANRLEACEKKEANINNAMQKIAERRTKQVEVFNKIADRTIDYYEEHGASLVNYEELVEDVNTKRAAAEAEIASLKSSTVDFKCESEDPLKVSEAFKEAREGVVVAMKEYKTSVKNLIVGVKSVVSATTADEGSEE